MPADTVQSPARGRGDSKFLLNPRKNVSLDAEMDLVRWTPSAGSGT